MLRRETPPAEVELPAGDGPFIEPPLRERPALLYLVSVGCTRDIASSAELRERLAGIAAVPIGYPAVEAGEAGCLWRVVAGKFARRPWAERLASILRQVGLEEAAVIERPYRHDRFAPAANPDSSRTAGMVFAGLAGEKVPLLAGASLTAGAAGAELADGTWVEVAEKLEAVDGDWYRVAAGPHQGFLPAGRLLTGHNLYPAPDGHRAVLQISTGCGGGCRSDWWLVGKGFGERRLLAAAEERFVHAFSPDGTRLAWAASAGQLFLQAGEKELELGPGTSPSWTAAGERLYFRRPATGGSRDEIVFAEPPDWQVRVLYDFPGRPFYPRGLSAHPPPVDVLAADSRLFSMFLRLEEKDGGRMLVRWKVALDSQGRLLGKRGEQMTE